MAQLQEAILGQNDKNHPFIDQTQFYALFKRAVEDSTGQVLARAELGYNATHPVYTMFLAGKVSILSIIFMKIQRLSGMIETRSVDYATLIEESADIANYALFLHAWLQAEELRGA